MRNLRVYCRRTRRKTGKRNTSILLYSSRLEPAIRLTSIRGPVAERASDTTPPFASNINHDQSYGKLGSPRRSSYSACFCSCKLFALQSSLGGCIVSMRTTLPPMDICTTSWCARAGELHICCSTAEWSRGGTGRRHIRRYLRPPPPVVVFAFASGHRVSPARRSPRICDGLHV